MILLPFDLTSRGRRFRFVDSAAVSSDDQRKLIQGIAQAEVAKMQKDAQRGSLGPLVAGFSIADGFLLSFRAN